ncbi:Ribulokinase [Suttonella ornithocola]|uniref:Ribulokinase n=1 Tax=Suttonella ornithocola TaxID=279832 RepID=A0A380MP21_9GAMM|nr:FGGY family pentulose kinase [Suttonella ornithocola]SUO94369.1 Ribulokinase [Suttonella ornithocola]
MAYYLGVDVGTGSARAGVFDDKGALLAVAKQDIKIWRTGENIVEQSSENIWQAVCYAVRATIKASKIDPSLLKGIGFDATCSLVVLGENGNPLSVSMSGDVQRNIIVWMDYRANKEAAQINQGKYEVLRYVGGSISPEMQTPKLLWLSKHLPQTYQQAWQFMDLVDYLTWRATGALTRSLCTLTCKWTYLAHEERWDENYFRAIGLSDLVEQNFVRIGEKVVSPGTPLAEGLTEEVAKEWGVLPRTAVASGLIDAHAGGLGTVGALEDIEHTMAYIFGTSSCTMTSTQTPTFIVKSAKKQNVIYRQNG